MFERAVKMARFFGKEPPESKDYETRKLRLLVRICYQLQKLADPEPLHLSWKQAARVLKVSAECAGDYLRILLADGRLTLVEKHTDKKATMYRYNGDSETRGRTCKVEEV